MNFLATPRKLRLAVAIAVPTFGVLVACGSSTTPAESVAAPVSAPAEPSVAPTVGTAEVALGTVLVDANGMTLYRFDKDTNGASACADDCALTWPPLVLANGQALALSGTDLDAHLGVIARSDGSMQVTFDGHPLYRFSGDVQPGQTSGDGVGGVWHAQSTVTQAAAVEPATGSGSGYGYGN